MGAIKTFGFKFLKGGKKKGVRSKHGDEKSWVIGRWRSVKGKVIVCKNGYHCSPTPVEARRWCATSTVALVEVKGEHQQYRKDPAKPKSAWQSMRIVHVARYRASDIRAFIKFLSTLPSSGAPPSDEYKYHGDGDLTRINIEARRIARDVIDGSRKGHKAKNEAAMTAWWVDRLLSRPSLVG